MKKILYAAALLAFINHASAQNTFPTGAGTNVGINIASPIYPLDVRGDVNIGTLLRFANNTVTTFGTTDAHPTIYSTAATGTVYPFLSAGNLVLQARSSTSARDIIFAGSLTPTVQMIIQGSTGNVGIGTIAPAAGLHIAKANSVVSARGGLFISSTDDATGDFGGQLGFGGSYTGSTQTYWAGIAGRKENATDADYSGYLQFITRKNGSNAVERMRVSSDGNLGVGTTTPGLKTHINGITGFPATTGTAQTGVLRLQGLSNNAVLDFGVNGILGAYLQSTNQTALNSNYPLLLNPNGGNVSIGTTAPATISLLQVQKNIDGATLGSFVNTDPGVNAKASVSVGSTPSIGGTFGSFEYLGAGRTVTGLLGPDRTMLRGNGTGGLMLTAENAAGNIAFATGGASGNNERMRITSDGNVSIGTTDPKGYKLAVNGSVVANAVTVKVYPWADYVFNDDYKLLSLTEVKKYIDKNHHLPDMPSAAQVQKDGLNLGEINTALTKKVEELTLYLIEKNDQLNKQQKEIDLLKEQFKSFLSADKKQTLNK